MLENESPPNHYFFTSRKTREQSRRYEKIETIPPTYNICIRVIAGHSSNSRSDTPSTGVSARRCYKRRGPLSAQKVSSKKIIQLALYIIKLNVREVRDNNTTIVTPRQPYLIAPLQFVILCPLMLAVLRNELLYTMTPDRARNASFDRVSASYL